MSRRSKWSFKYPPGAMQRREDLLDLVIEARKTKRPIRIYRVAQMGHIEEFILTRKSRLGPNKYGFDTVNGWNVYSRGRTVPDRYRRGEFFLGDSVIGHEHHRTFSNRRHAENYAAELKNDPEYVLSVKEHWAYCDRMFGRIGLR